MNDILNVNTQFKKNDIDVFLTSRKKPYLITTEQVIEYWNKKNWLTTKGEKVTSISTIVNVANSFLTEKNVKKVFCQLLKQQNSETTKMNGSNRKVRIMTN